MENALTKHYKKYNISPSYQGFSTQSELSKKLYIRKKLYESLGLPSEIFKKSSLLEVGPGPGYDSLYIANIKPFFYKLIEPNKIAFEDCRKTFNHFNVNMNNIDIQNIYIEQLDESEKFDIVICENLLICIENSFDILKLLDLHLKKNGVLVINCCDEISFFFEACRHFLFSVLCQRNVVKSFDDKIKLGVDAFGSHLETLKGLSRSKENWCADNLLAARLYTFSVVDAIKFLQDSYSFYHICPRLILDDTWFKEVPLNTQDYNNKKIENFYNVWHNLIHYKVFDCHPLPKHDLDRLRRFCNYFYEISNKARESYEENLNEEALEIIRSIKKILVKNPQKAVIESLNDLIHILESDNVTAANVAGLQHFKSAFGRGTQYVSFIKANSLTDK